MAKKCSCKCDHCKKMGNIPRKFKQPVEANARKSNLPLKEK